MGGKDLRGLAAAVLLAGTIACGDRPRTAPAAGALARYDLAGAPTWRASLPTELTEISGLATTADGRVFTHGDEEATVYQIDPRAGTVIKRFTLTPTGADPDLGKKSRDGRLAGDFEGLAIAGDRFFLVTSTGVLLEFAEGADGAAVPYTAHPTTLGKTCEVEGLEHDAAGDGLLLLCKTMRDKAERQQVAVYRWSAKDRTLGESARWIIPWDALALVTGGRAFNASGLALVPGGGSLAMVAGPQRLFAEVSAEGMPLAGGAFDQAAHPQPEGIAFLQDGTLLVSSEGRKGTASLSGYAPR